MVETRRDGRRDQPRLRRSGGGRASAVRRAHPADAHAILTLLVDVAAQNPLALLTDLPSDARGLEAGLLASAEDRLLVAIASSEPTGVDAVIFVVRGPGPASHTANLSVAVRASARRRGLATALIAAAADWGAPRGVERLTASVAAANGPALALFGAAGFAVEGRRPDQIRVAEALHDEVLFGARVADLVVGTHGPSPRGRVVQL